MARTLHGTILSLAALWFMSASAFAQSQQTANTLKLDSKENMPKATVADFAWLTGHWVGEGLGGQCDELWAPVTGDNLTGLFRYIKDGKTQFTEIFSIIREGDSVVLALKHFNADMTGWEEKDKVVRFALVKFAANEAHFDGLTYRLKDGDRLEVFVVMKKKDGSVSELEFQYKRASE